MKTKNLMNEVLKRALAVLGGVMLCAASPVCAQTANADDTATQSTNAATAEVAMPEATRDAAAEGATNAPAGSKAKSLLHRHGRNQDAVVAIGSDAELKEGDTAGAVVAIGGNAMSKGTVRDAVVAVFGNAEVSGEVGDAVVAVLGNVKLLPGAKVRGEVVSVGGTVEKAEGVEIGGQVQEVNFGALGLPKIEWLKSWFKECVLKMRPLAPSVGWVWIVAGAFFLLYLLVTLAFPRPVQSCVDELMRRPATTFLVGLMTKMLIPIVSLILVATGIGIFIVPFLTAAVLFAGILGKVALLQYFGQQLGKQFSGGERLSPLLALLIGAALLTVLYLVPVLGLLTFLVTGMWAIGAAVMAMFGGMRREMPERPQPPTASAPAAYAATAPMNMTSFAPAAAIAPMPVGAADGSSAQAGGTPPAFGAPQVATTALATTSEAWTLPRAGFWERMGAAFLDVILVAILGGLIGGPPLGFLVALAYFAGMWAWKGTTIGGIVLKLKVVRLDSQPVTFPVALVRGLAAAFSVVVFFLGFLWIAWDKEKQGWHDKIAGTAVVRLPRTQSLVCF